MTTTTKDAKRLRDAAAPGEWKCEGRHYVDLPRCTPIARFVAPRSKDAAFLAHAANNLVPVCEERDALKARAIDAEAERDYLAPKLAAVHGAICDAETVTDYLDDPARSVRELIAERDQLAARNLSLEELREIVRELATEPEDSTKWSWALVQINGTGDIAPEEAERDELKKELANAIKDRDAYSSHELHHRRQLGPIREERDELIDRTQMLEKQLRVAISDCEHAAGERDQLRESLAREVGSAFAGALKAQQERDRQQAAAERAVVALQGVQLDQSDEVLIERAVTALQEAFK